VCQVGKQIVAQYQKTALPMPKDTLLKSESKQEREPFTTIDDLIGLAQELFVRLRKLGEYKHPLDVRRGNVRRARKEVGSMKEDRESRQVKAGSRTYFVDVETTREGKRYLRITESRFKGEGSERERQSIVVFPEEAEEFAQAVSEMAAKLG
jgi:hypothetical protein